MKEKFKNTFALIAMGLIALIPNSSFAQEGARPTQAQWVDIIGQQAPMPGEYLIVNVATRMCLGKNIVKETGKEILLTMKCNEAMVKRGDYKEFLSIIANHGLGISIRNAKSSDKDVEQGKYGQCVNYDLKDAEHRPLYWSDCSNQKTDAKYKTAGTLSQSFDFVYLSNKQWEIHPTPDLCLDLMHPDGGNSEVVPKYCDYSDNQHWAVIYRGDLKNGLTRDAVISDGYALDANNRLVRARQVNGIKMSAAQSTTIDTPNDNGAKCRAECVKDNKCFSFSWSQKPQNGANKCELHNALPNIVQQKNYSSVRVFRPIEVCKIDDWKPCLIKQNLGK